jgi:hypothetical protein
MSVFLRAVLPALVNVLIGNVCPDVSPFSDPVMPPFAGIGKPPADPPEQRAAPRRYTPQEAI